MLAAMSGIPEVGRPRPSDGAMKKGFERIDRGEQANESNGEIGWGGGDGSPLAADDMGTGADARRRERDGGFKELDDGGAVRGTAKG